MRWHFKVVVVSVCFLLMGCPSKKGIVSGVKIGSVTTFAGKKILIENDKNWLFCDGSEVKVNDYKELFNAIGYKYTDPAQQNQTFNLPNLNGKTVIGVDNSNEYLLGTEHGSKVITHGKEPLSVKNNTDQIYFWSPIKENLENPKEFYGARKEHSHIVDRVKTEESNLQPSMALFYIIKAK